MIFREKKKSDLHYFHLQAVNFVQKSEIFRKFSEIADDHNSGTEYARDMKFVSKCVVLNTLYLGCTTENPFLLQKSKFIIFCSKFGPKELNHAATGLRLRILAGDLKSSGRDVKKGPGLLDIPVPPLQVSAPRRGDREQLKCSEYIVRSCN